MNSEEKLYFSSVVFTFDNINKLYVTFRTQIIDFLVRFEKNICWFLFLDHEKLVINFNYCT